MAAIFGEQRKLLKHNGSRLSPARLRELERRGFALRGTDPRQAAHVLGSVLEHEPDRVSALRARGRVLLQLREFEAARPHWERLDGLCPGEVEAPLQLARIHLRANRPFACAAHARRVLAINPLHEEAKTLLARAEEIGAAAGSDESPAVEPEANAPEPGPPVNRPGWLKRFEDLLRRAFGRRPRAVPGQPLAVAPAPKAAATSPAPAEARVASLDPALLLARADERARRGDIDGLVDSLETAAGIAGPVPQVVEALIRHRPAILAAVAGTAGARDSRATTALATRARRLWVYLPEPAAATPEPVAAPILPRPATRGLDAASLIASADEYAREGDVSRLIETLDLLAGLAGPEPEVLRTLQRHRGMIDRALADALYDIDGATRAMLSVRARRLWTFLPNIEPALPAAATPAPEARLDPPSLIALADELAQSGAIARLVETLDVLAGIAGPQAEVVDALARHRPAIDAALARTDGAFDHPTRTLLLAHVRRLWAFLPDAPTQVSPAPPALPVSAARPDPPFLIGLAGQLAQAGEIRRLIETLNALAGAAGPRPEVLDTFARHRPAIDAALARTDGAFDQPTRTLLLAHVRRLWAFLPDTPPSSSSEPGEPQTSRIDTPYLIEAAENYGRRNDIPRLIETLDILASVAGPKPEVIDTLARYRETIDAALASGASAIDYPARAELTARARRLWVFLLDTPTVSAPAPARPESAPEPQQPNLWSLIEAADIHARLGEFPELIDTLDTLAGIAGPQPDVVAALSRHRPAIDVALARSDGPMDAESRTALSARARRLWAFLPGSDSQAAAGSPHVAPQQPARLDVPSLIDAAADYASSDDVPNLVRTLDLVAGIAGPRPEVLETLTRYRPLIEATLGRTDHRFDSLTRSILTALSRRLWAFLPPLPPEPPPPVEEPVIPNARLDTPYLLALAAEYSRQADIPRLVKTLDVLAGVAGPQPEVIETLARHRPAVDAALAQTDGPLDNDSRAMLSVRVRRLWAFLPDLAVEPAPGEWTSRSSPRQLDWRDLIAVADEQAQSGDMPSLVQTLDRLVETAGPQPEIIATIARHHAAIDAAAARSDGVADDRGRAALRAGARRLRAFLPDEAAAPAPVVPAAARATPQPLDVPTLVSAAEDSAREGDVRVLVETLDLLVGTAGPQPEVIAALARHRPAVDAGLARTDGLLDARSRALLGVRARRLWAYLPDRSAEPAPQPQPKPLDAATLIALADDHERDGNIPALVETLDLLVGTAGPEPEVIATLARHRPGLDAALERGDGPLDARNRAMLSARARRLWAFLPDEPAAPKPAAPRTRRPTDAPALISRADDYALKGDIRALIETLDLLVGTAGPQPEVVATLARHRSVTDAALARTDSQLDAQSRALARRLWAFLPDEPGAAAPAQPAPRQLDPLSLVAEAHSHARDGDVRALVETLDLLVGRVGPQPEIVAVLAQYRPIVDAALSAPDSRISAMERSALSVRARRLWAFLPDAPAETMPTAPSPERKSAPLDPAKLLAAAEEHAGRGDIPALLAALDVVAGTVGPQPEVVDSLLRHRPAIDAALARTDGPLDAQNRAMLAVRARRLWAILPETQEPQPSRHPAAEPARPPVPEAVAERVESRIRKVDPNTWLEAARLAARTEDRETVVACAREAVKAAQGDRAIFKEVTTFLAECGLHEEVIALWRAAYEEAPTDLSLALSLLRAIEASTQPLRMFDELQALIAAMQPFARFTAANVTSFVEMFRRLATHGEKAGRETQLGALEATLREHQLPSALLYWALGTLNVWRFDRAAAFVEFDKALEQAPLPAGSILDLHAERALLWVRYHLYGEALAEIAQVPDRLLKSNAFYQRRLGPVLAVAELCPDAPAPLRYPECLIDIIFDEIRREPLGYEPRPRHLVMVSGSLGQGGGERQTITVVKRMITDPRIAKLTLLVRSTHLRPTDDFFLPVVSQLPLDCHIYGKNWYAASVVEKKLPEIANRPRLAKAIDLLPQTIREDVLRISRHLFDERPEAVHIWQDITGAALACMMCGVPNFFVHRGSLSPDYWGQTERQTETHFRPMKHTYRRLLERPDFVLLNNSDAGCKSDQNWTRWPDSKPFQFLANAIDFSVLGPNIGKNMELRHSLGIPVGALVVGGSFRIFSVKRPEYWIAACGIIGAAVPNAHFLIIGDGDMTELVQERAKEYGIADRLHLPGRVSNVGDWYRAMDLSLLTSEREGIPNALIEAQHFGVPIVATHVGGIPEAIEEGSTGYTAPGNSPDEYAERVIAILRDEEWRARAAIRAPEFVHTKFSLERVCDTLIAYYGFPATAPANQTTGAV